MPRLTIDLGDAHELVKLAALGRKQSLAAWINAAIRAAILHQARRGPGGVALAAELDSRAKTR